MSKIEWTNKTWNPVTGCTKMSEEKNIGKSIIGFLKTMSSLKDGKTVSNEDFDSEALLEWAAWLEKQGEQKPTDEVEHKFNIGDWIVYNRNDYSREIMQIYDIRDGRYYFNDNVHFSWSIKECDEKSHCWTIQDAKDGDVLYLQHDGVEHVIIYKGFVKKNFNTFLSAYCAYNGFVHDFCFADVSIYACITSERDEKEIYPATKEQRDKLEKAITEAGYEWDAEKKELRKKKREYQFTPFEKVLVRDSDEETWRINLFSHIITDTENSYVCMISVWKQCIPYEGNEHLVGTNKKPE